MRRSALAFALLLASAPVAGATETTPAPKPEVRGVEVPAPVIRQEVKVVQARAEAPSTKAERRAQMDREAWTIVAVAIGVIIAALLFL